MAETVTDDPMRWCPRCERGMPSSRCRLAELGASSGVRALMCGACDGVTREVDVVEHHELGDLYRAAWRYPWADGHWIGLVALGAGSWFFGHVPLVGGVLAASIVATYLMSVVRSTALGGDDMPEPTDFVHWTDYTGPALRSVAAMLVGFAPLMLVAAYGGGLPRPLWYALMGVTGALGLAWLPGALAWASFSGGFFQALNPGPVLALVTRIPRDYAVTVGVVWALALLHAAVMAAITLAMRPFKLVPVLPGVLHEVAGLLLPMVIARIVGLLLRARREEIGMDE